MGKGLYHHTMYSTHIRHIAALWLFLSFPLALALRAVFPTDLYVSRVPVMPKVERPGLPEWGYYQIQNQISNVYKTVFLVFSP